MEQVKTDTFLNPHPVGGRLVVVNETKTQKTNYVGPPLLFRTFSTLVRMQGRDTWEVGKQLLNVQILIIWLLMSPSIGRRLRSILLNLRLNPLYILTPPRFWSISKFIHITLEFYIFIV